MKNKYEIDLPHGLRGSWGDYIDLLNSNPLERSRFENRFPDKNYTENECHVIGTTIKGRSKRVEIKDMGKTLSIRVSIRTVYYLRHYKTLRFLYGAPTCGNMGCVNPLHQNVGSPGDDAPVPVQQVGNPLVAKMMRILETDDSANPKVPRRMLEKAIEQVPKFIGIDMALREDQEES